MKDPIASAGQLQISPADHESDKKEADNADVRSVQHGENDLLKAQIIDKALAAKMTMINDVGGIGQRSKDFFLVDLSLIAAGYRRDWLYSASMETVLS